MWIVLLNLFFLSLKAELNSLTLQEVCLAESWPSFWGACHLYSEVHFSEKQKLVIIKKQLFSLNFTTFKLTQAYGFILSLSIFFFFWHIHSKCLLAFLVHSQATSLAHRIQTLTFLTWHPCTEPPPNHLLQCYHHQCQHHVCPKSWIVLRY